MAGDDRVVPRERSLALLQVLRQPVLVETLPGTHNGIYETAAMDEALRRAVDAVIDAAEAHRLAAAGPIRDRRAVPDQSE